MMTTLGQNIRKLASNPRGSAAVEMALVTPLLVILMFGSMELGNYFLNQHAVSKQVRDGARFASRMTLASAYDCIEGPAADSGVFEDPGATATIVNVTKTGSVGGSATGRFGDVFWADACGQSAEALTVTMRCVAKDLYGGIYTGLAGNIPVVTVSADVAYPSLFGTLGFNASALCLRATSEAAVAGL